MFFSGNRVVEILNQNLISFPHERQSAGDYPQDEQVNMKIRIKKTNTIKGGPMVGNSLPLLVGQLRRIWKSQLMTEVLVIVAIIVQIIFWIDRIYR